ncbi:hypothetical protein BH10BAC1_BH10BAC1_21830 [soil metagenome]
MNISQDKIHLKVARDFGETFNVSIKFLRQNFVSFFTCLLLLAGPFVLLYSFTSAHHQAVIMEKTALVKSGRLYNMNIYTWEYFLSLLFQFISYLSMICTTYSYIIVYSEKGKGNFTVADVAKKMNTNIGKIIGGFFLFFLLTIIFVVALFFIVGMIIQASPILGGLLVFILFIGFLLVGPNLLWQLNTAFLVILAEDEIPISAYGRTRVVMKNNYWWTWLIVVCATFMVSLLSLLFVLPTSIYSLIHLYSNSSGEEGSSILFTIISCICIFLATSVYSIFYIISTFHYFSLSEKTDGKGLLERINEIGNTQKNTVEQQF